MAKMREYIFRGSVTKLGVEFIVKARNLNEAIAKAKEGKFDDYDDIGAETSDWELNPKTGRENI